MDGAPARCSCCPVVLMPSDLLRWAVAPRLVAMHAIGVALMATLTCAPISRVCLQAAHGTLPLGSKRSKNVFWAGAAEEAQPASSSSDEEEDEEER